MSAFKDSGHLFRLAALYAVGTLTFLAIRGYFVPRSFGQYGHYRGAAITEIAAQSHPFCRPPGLRDLSRRRCDNEKFRKARARQLRGVSWAVSNACR